jgi:hypothetical protein
VPSAYRYYIEFVPYYSCSRFSRTFQATKIIYILDELYLSGKNQDSLGGIVAGLQDGWAKDWISIPGRTRDFSLFLQCQDRSLGLHILLCTRYGKHSLGLEADAHLHQMPRLRMLGAMPPRSRIDFQAKHKNNITVTFFLFLKFTGLNCSWL